MNPDTSPELIDIAVNFTDKAFAPDRREVLARAADAGVTAVVIPGSTLAESEAALELCQQHPRQLFCTAGIHPHYARDFNSDSLISLKELCKEPAVRALGETGLDFNRNFSTPEQQLRAFEQQLELACETGMPLLMHERDAHQAFIERVKAHRDHLSRAVLHCFTGSREALFACLDLDLHIGITGWICDERRGEHLKPLVRNIPANRLMLETDAPYLLPRDLRPKPKSRRNEPCLLPHVAQRVADCRGETLAQLAAATTATARAFFDL
ncbi:TatD family hydrolase [Motiliproteus sp. SC1-56]|uniref:TatD family hydrolase n=1 Tax=Motiliproteus sp. SC1-56 TaxID=2799565 RepID=UPI001A8EF3D3|nr:TatD family hydrolase [Motiliproteus sp. SC1-56]